MQLEILADELMGQGDVRGELMMMQLQPSTPRFERQIQSLTTKHCKHLLGPLDHVLEHPKFERGWLQEVLAAARARGAQVALTSEPLLRRDQSPYW